MGKDSDIQWTHHTFNPWRGCTRVSEGCRNCYAETLSKRNPATLGFWGPNGTRVVAAEAMWRQPLKWDKEAREAGERRRVFCASLADVFEDWDGRMKDAKGHDIRVNGDGTWQSDDGSAGFACGRRTLHMEDVRRRLATLIWETPHLDWLLLTKRIENAREMIYRMWFPDAEWPKNYWLGTTVENQEMADQRIPILLEIPAAVRFLSVEPQIGPIDFRKVPGFNRVGIDLSRWWSIQGGESGPSARPFDIEWARNLRDQCRAAGVAYFCKQLGARPYEGNLDRMEAESDWPSPLVDGNRGYLEPVLRDSHGGNWDEWPADLRVREFPCVPAMASGAEVAR